MRVSSASVMLLALIASRVAAQDPLPPNERGSASARVTIVEYCAYDSEACSRLEVIINSVLLPLPAGETHLVFRYVGAGTAPAQSMRYRAALAAGEQGAFWAMHDTLLANRDRASQADVVAIASQLGLDVARLTSDMERPAVLEAVERDREDAATHGVTSVPAVLVNGRAVSVRNAADLRAAIGAALGR